MRRLLPALILAASCGARHRFEQPAAVSLLGPAARLETWDAQAAEGIHLHPREGAACAAMAALLEAGVRTAGDLKSRALADTVSDMVEEITLLSHGPACGGPGRLTLALRGYAAGGEISNEALLVAVPLLGEGQRERAFAAPDIAAAYYVNDPLPRLQADLERGRVGVRRLGPGRYDLDLFLVLKSVPPGRTSDRLQVVARVEAATAR